MRPCSPARGDATTGERRYCPLQPPTRCHSMHEQDTSANTTTHESGRDSQGRFAKGNRGGPGNPHARRCAHLKQLLQSATSDEDVLEVLAVLKRLALGGDVQAIKLFLAYQIGTPAEIPDPDTLDQHELKIALENHAPCDREIFNVLHNFPADLLAEMLRHLLPQLAEQKKANLVDYLRDPLAQPHQEKRHCDVALERGPDQQPIPAAPGPCEHAGEGARDGQRPNQRLGADNGSDPGRAVAGRATDTNGANGI